MTPAPLVKAQLIELDAKGKEAQQKVEVQFNPETLKVSFTNQVQAPKDGGDKSNASAQQFVGKGSTKLTVQLWFDVTGVLGEAAKTQAAGDVRKLTKEVVYFITPQQQKGGKEKKFIPPRLRFLWGSFQFDGIVEGMEESLEFFSPEGRPLRASVSLSLIQQEIQFQFGQAAAAAALAGSGGGPAAGTAPLTPAPAGATMPGLADQRGQGDQWQRTAAANGIENPRQLPVGKLINLNLGLE